jgi:DUF971 family protein
MPAAKPWPTEIRLAKDRKNLRVSFDDGQAFDFAAEFLRVESPSAEVKGHNPSERVTVPGKRNVEIVAVEPVGNYAVRLTFDDTHNTGIFSWEYFRELGAKRNELWSAYLKALKEKGLSRDA